ncbi:GTP pyrophosphokinase/guanosine-3',5'-bis(diphosphate) 3'-pyrophosphohydrolase [Inmirania thermothiophila]|uniref:guanosine-3',5'-bis(diphosphate) 3'-diphosphatase n=2 Tax=Inmirania thermothiophila TaxID=1750597 RepID=A0A3N1Y5P9_9GAMM|nr:GTP pyrophosphokinase/guanosine-3',5'-bis(diphosphate) 3'-pyrophosphohydrolase [Inmirania thermothiophila]
MNVSESSWAVFRIGDLGAMLEAYLEPEQVAAVYRAYEFASRAHAGQRRMSGEPYILHPLEVARIVAEMRMDAESIMAALLHDVLEDTAVSKETLAQEFSEEVAELVDGVTKLTQLKVGTQAEAQAESFRKMILAMGRDIRVILIKLADRLHNMRTLAPLPPEKRRRIARETLEIYAPIANRLGMNSLRLELEDLGFAALYPMRHRVLREAVVRARGNRKEIMGKITEAIRRRLADEGLGGRVIGREKHLYGIYLKMRRKGVSLGEVMDVYAVRIIVDSVDTCYRVLGAVHNLYKPVPGRFKDYIAIPKANGYQSLHTTLFGPWGVPIEVQIRTWEMDRVAESGIAAHWLYKSGESGAPGPQARAAEWLRNLLEMQKSAGNSVEFLEHVKIDLFPDEIYVFTPNGEIKRLPRGATPVDFAYAVHTDVGNHCVAAKVDRRLVPLRTPLQTGQTVEILTAPTARPNPAWLSFVATGKARANIRNYLKRLERDDAIRLGRQLLDQALAGQGAGDVEDVPPRRRDEVLAEYGLAAMDDLLAEIGLGRRSPELVARRLAAGGEEGERAAGRTGPLAITGAEGMVVTYARCCHPIPGDPIVGFLSAGRGLVIHAQSCRNLRSGRVGEWLEVDWAERVEGEFPVAIRIDAVNQRGVLATIAAAIAECGCNIEDAAVHERDGRHSAIDLTIAVRDRVHVAAVMRRLRRIRQVLRLARLRRG